MELFSFKSQVKNYSFKQFVVLRVVLGIYLLVHFVGLFPYSSELFSKSGIFGNASANPSYGIFPDLLYWFDEPYQIQVFLCALILLAVLFIVGFKTRAVSFLLWYGWACLLNRNNLISNPGIPYVGWLLLVIPFIPERNDNWEMPRWILSFTWILVAFGYTISGLDKLNSPTWLSGDTFKILLENPLARNTFLCEWFLLFPDLLLKIFTLLILLSEILFLPLSVYSHTRKYAWLLIVILHLNILVFINFADLTIGMLMVHIFTFDVNWFPMLILKLKTLTLRRTEPEFS